jgi:hypothetical protein
MVILITAVFCLIGGIPDLLGWDRAFGVVAELVYVVAIPVYLAWLLVVCFRHQKWMNDRIAKEIEKRSMDELHPAQRTSEPGGAA